MFRVAWRELESGNQAHGQPVHSRDVAQQYADEMNLRLAGRVEHWVEELAPLHTSLDLTDKVDVSVSPPPFIREEA